MLTQLAARRLPQWRAAERLGLSPRRQVRRLGRCTAVCHGDEAEPETIIGTKAVERPTATGSPAAVTWAIAFGHPRRCFAQVSESLENACGFFLRRLVG